MPLYEYACQECAHQFEVLVRASETPECPSCHATSLDRRLSVFAAHTSGTGSAASRMSEAGRVRHLRRPARTWRLLDELAPYDEQSRRDTGKPIESHLGASASPCP